MGSFWLTFCKWTSIRGWNSAILWKMANISTLPFPKYIHYTKTYFWSMRQQKTVCSTLSINLCLKCFTEIEPAGSFLKTCYIFTAICRNGLSKQISESKICYFLPPLIHYSYNVSDISNWRWENSLSQLCFQIVESNDNHKRVETGCSRDIETSIFCVCFKLNIFKILSHDRKIIWGLKDFNIGKQFPLLAPVNQVLRIKQLFYTPPTPKVNK